ncbi:DEAD/DEAH box helicase family protein [Clostridium sp. 'deep sea']|uniref:DEAD/DEAH box helicase n=1 Tax=Clostridium sp. 'deep sea' TaxID=2779445 RepID=UPI0018964BC9|nr:DEAD/DEAH box helicase [Clostridium sp. 'deep sea']QOR34751.1 DEAD/DEAH box helicase family protein [Clostridium sp. 'deep sea']
MGILKDFSKEVNKDEYFIELYRKMEIINFSNFFGLNLDVRYDEKEYFDLLRYSEILSFSDEPEDRNKSYKILSLLYSSYLNDQYYISYANEILVRLGNFPALDLVTKGRKNIQTSNEIEMEKIIKKTFQKDPYSINVFTDPQYNIYESLKKNNHFSFSGPTSLGKSFIMESFIKYLIYEHGFRENIAILVPTRALINQVSSKMKQELEILEAQNKAKIKYKVLSHPVIPKLLDNTNNRYLFVFTPERLISYLSNSDNPKIDYMFIDEAHKVVAINDSRGPLFYHAILQAERKSVKLFFSSPNVPNVDVFLSLFEKSTEEATQVNESPVSQNRYFLDLINNEITMFSEFGNDLKMDIVDETNSFNSWLYKLSSDSKSIVYCNSTKDTIRYASEFSRDLPIKNHSQINELINLVKVHVHKDYYLIDCLKKGVAYHFGRLPQRIREKIEVLFKNKVIDFIFCTSTLLEGVNLPAKNIFILSNYLGLSKFKDIDFWNLAGRAGRLTKELSGNIICTKVTTKQSNWGNIEGDLDIVRNKTIEPIKPLVIKGQKNFYKNVGNALKGMKFTKKKPTANEVEIWNHYANIAFIHELNDEPSVLKTNFVSKVSDGKKVLSTLRKNNQVPTRVLSTSSMIKAKYQNYIYNGDKTIFHKLPEEITYEACLNILNNFYDIYNWSIEESKGRSPLVKKRTRLKYYARLMKDWMNSTPLSLMITNVIDYYKDVGEFYDQPDKLKFTGKEKNIINMIINELMRDIETNLRFKIKNYFSNYHLLLREKYGENDAGANWGDFLEYGTSNRRIIELQNIGLPRYLATSILEEYNNYIEFIDDELTYFDIEGIINLMEENDPQLIELKTIFRL